MTVLAGLDLAWSGRRPSGICLLHWDETTLAVEELRTSTMTSEETAAWLNRLGPDVVAAIDGPLVATEVRRAEAEMARAHPGTGLYAYSARPDFLERHGIAAGPALGALLTDAGWNLDPASLAGQGRHAIEVFPHAVAVSLLGAGRIFRYKKGSRASRLEAFLAFQAALTAFAVNHCGLSADSVVAARLRASAGALRGAALKAHEDELDAIACAFAAYHFLSAGPAGMRVFGDACDGYIAVPAWPPASASADDNRACDTITA